MERPYAMLRGKLVQQGLCIYEFGKMLGFRSENAIYGRFTGKLAWSIDEIYRAADLLGIPDAEILNYFPRDGKNRLGVKADDHSDRSAVVRDSAGR